MTAPKSVLLLTGSPEGKNSTSNSLGSYLIKRLDEKGIKTDTVHIYSALRSDEGTNDLLLKIKNADLLILSFPIYADAPTAGVISVLQAIAEERKVKLSPGARSALETAARLLESEKVGVALALAAVLLKRISLPTALAMALTSALQNPANYKKAAVKIRDYLKSQNPGEQKIVVMCNSGFLEPDRSGTALDICRRFASETGIEWAGGIVFGGGPFIGGRPLEKTGRITRTLRHGLDVAAADIAEKGQVSQEAVDLIASPIMPGWLYILIASAGWRFQAWKNGVLWKLGARPTQTS